MHPRTNCLSCNWMEPIEPLGPCQKPHPELSESPGFSKKWTGKNTTGCYNTMCRFTPQFTDNRTKSLVHVPKDGTAQMLVLQWYFAQKNWCHQQARVSNMTCLAMPAKVYMITKVNIASLEVFVDLTLNSENLCISISELSKGIPFDFWTWRVAAKPIEPANWSMWKLKLTFLTCLESNWGSCSMQILLEAGQCKDRFVHVACCPVLISQAWMLSLQLMSSYSADTPIDLLIPIQMLAAVHRHPKQSLANAVLKSTFLPLLPLHTHHHHTLPPHHPHYTLLQSLRPLDPQVLDPHLDPFQWKFQTST